MWPRKYLLTTTLVASWLQNAGTSTSFCSKTVLPDSLPMLAVRISQVISSYGCTPGLVQRRGNVRPFAGRPSSVSPSKLTPYAPRFRGALGAAVGAVGTVEAGVAVVVGALVADWIIGFVIVLDSLLLAVATAVELLAAPAIPGPEITTGSRRSLPST